MKVASDGRKQHRRSGDHSSERVRVKARLQQHELAIARDDEVVDLAVACRPPSALAHQYAQIAGERRVGIVDRLVLADETAQSRRDRAGPRFQRRILRAPRPAAAAFAGSAKDDRDSEHMPVKQESRCNAGASFGLLQLRRVSCPGFCDARRRADAQAPVGQRERAADEHHHGAEPDQLHQRLALEPHAIGAVGQWRRRADIELPTPASHRCRLRSCRSGATEKSRFDGTSSVTALPVSRQP